VEGTYYCTKVSNPVKERRKLAGKLPERPPERPRERLPLRLPERLPERLPVLGIDNPQKKVKQR